MGTSTWLSAVPIALVAAFWVIVPGLLVTRASGLRGITAWGSAPLVSVTVIATSAALGTLLVIPWSPWVPLAAAVLTAGCALLFRILLARRPADSPVHGGLRSMLRSWEPGRRVRAAMLRLRTPRGTFARGPDPLTTRMPQVWRTSAQREGTDGRRAGAAALIGVLGGAALGWMTVVRGFGPVDALSSTYDAVFHYSGVAHILGTGDASSLTLGRVNNPAASTALYPAAWHDLVSLVVLGSGAAIPEATNLTAWAVAALVFPLSALLLTRQLVGRSAVGALAAPLLASGFTAAPWMLMSFGVLWPNLIGIAVLPASLAALATVVGATRDSVLRPGGAALLFLLTVPGIGFAHPNAVFSLAVLGLFPVLWGVARLARHRLSTIRFWQPVLAAVTLSALVGTTLWLMIYSPLLAGVRSFDWPAFIDTPGAVREVLTNGTNGRPILTVLSGLVLVGLVGALRRASTSWLVPAHAASGLLYVLAASREDALTAGLTGAWYNDSFRLAAMVPVTGVPLAVIGLLTLATLTCRLAALVPVARPLTRRREATTVTAVAGLAAALVLSGGMNLSVHTAALEGPYRSSSAHLLEPGQREFLLEVGTMIPEDSVVAANPFTGNSLLFPLTGRAVLFPHMAGNWTLDQLMVAGRLRDAVADPQVCRAVAATGTTHVLNGPVSFWPWDNRSRDYPGLDGLGEVPGFELLAAGGGNELWSVTACGATATWPSPAPTDAPAPDPQR